MDLLAAIRHSARGLTRRPGFAVAVLLSVAIGIGSNAAVLGFMNGLVSRRTPVDEGRTTVAVFARREADPLALLTHREYIAVEQQTGIFEAVIAARETRTTIRSGVRSVTGTLATLTRGGPAFFGWLTPGGVVISERLMHEFGGARQAVTRPLTIDGRPAAVSGVAPEAVEGLFVGRPVDAWAMAGDAAPLEPGHQSRTLLVLGRLRDGVSLREAQLTLEALAGPGISLITREYDGLTPEAQEGMTRLGTLMPAVAAAVFLIACANVAVFLLSRAASRARETSLRLALGATRAALTRAVLVDGALIACAGGVAGVLLGLWTSDVIPALLFEADAEDIRFTPGVAGVLVSAAVSAVIIVGCGMAPLLENRRDTPGAVLRRAPRRTSKPLQILRSALVVFQMAACCALVISAAVVSDALDATLRTRAGERLGDPVLATVAARHGYGRPEEGLTYFRAVADAVRAEPGISSAAWTGTLPGAPPSWAAVTVEPPGLPTRTVSATVDVFTPQSMDRILLPPKAGRMFGWQDSERSCAVAILHESAAERIFDGDAAGRVLHDAAGRAIEVAGVFAPRPPGASANHRLPPDIYYYAEQVRLPPAAQRVTFTASQLPPPTRAMLNVQVVSRDYFRVLGLPLRAGTGFPPPDQPTPCRAGVLNDEASQVYFGGNAVGGAVIDAQGRRTTIVGVVQDVRLRSTQRQAEPSLYLVIEQEFVPRVHLIFGAADSGGGLQAAVRRRIAAVEGGDPRAIAVTSLDERLRRTALASERIAALLLSAASINALALGVLGLHRIIADDVLARRREIAVRSALGAQRWRLIAMVVVRGGRLAAMGAAAGMVGALLLARWMQAATGLEGTFGWVWLAGPAVLGAGALVASVVPARRILAVDPLAAMRTD